MPSDQHLSSSEDDTTWDEELLRAVKLKVSESEKKKETGLEGVRLHRVRVCLGAGADINTQDRNRDTALHIAIKKNYKKIIEYLVERKSKTDISNNDDKTVMTLPEFNSLPKDILDKLEILNDNNKLQSGVDVSSSSRESDATSVAVCNQELSTPRGNDIGIQPNPNTVEDGCPSSEIEPHSIGHDESVERNRASLGVPEKFSAQTSTWVGLYYQLRHLEFTLHCALEKNAIFYLATEMVEARKLDDVVLMYMNDKGERVGRFVQIKHRDHESMEIFADELFINDGYFSLPKYFMTWRKVKESNVFSKIDVRNMILCTNIGLNLVDLTENNSEKKIRCTDKNRNKVLTENKIYWETAADPDKSFEFKSNAKKFARNSAWYKVSTDTELNEKLYNNLKTCVVRRLAKILAECVYDSTKIITLDIDCFKDYHLALVEHVFDAKEKEFHQKFIHCRDLSPSVEKFREIFVSEYQELSNKSKDHVVTDVWIDIVNRFKNVQIHANFGKVPNDWSEDKLLAARKLPDDIDDEVISDFLQEFTLAVNQPSLHDLGEIIKIFDNTLLNPLDADHINIFLPKILDWFFNKGRERNDIKYLSYEVSKKFLDDMKHNFNSHITSGLIALYCERMKSYDIHFKSKIEEVQKLLNTDGSSSPSRRIMQLRAGSEDTFLYGLWAYDTLRNITEYTKPNSHISIPFHNLTYSEIMDRVKRTFESPNHPDLLLVDFESNSVQPQNHELLNRLVKIIQGNTNKKMIIITREGCNLELAIQHNDPNPNPKGKNEINFDSLTDDSQTKLLEKRVTEFQGRKIQTTFGELLGIPNSNSLSVEELKDLSQTIDSDVLVELIRSDELKIGEPIDDDVEREGMREIEKYHIPRIIYQRVIIKEEIFKDSERKDWLAISSIDREASDTFRQVGKMLRTDLNISKNLSLDIKRDVVEHLENNAKGFDRTDWLAISGIDREALDTLGQVGKISRTDQNITNCDFLDSTREVEHFKDLCEKNKGCKIHWLEKLKSGKYIWKQSEGDITYLFKHRSATGDENEYSNDMEGTTTLEENILADQSNPVIISGAAGMGKSITLIHLAQKLKEKEPVPLVLKINLNRYSTALKNAKTKYDLTDIKQAIEFLLTELVSDKSDLAKKVFQRIIMNVTKSSSKSLSEKQREVAFLFDGFDEISPLYDDAVIIFLQTLKQNGLTKIVVATRPCTSETLECPLDAFSYQICPFSEINQEDFLTMFWTAKLNLDSEPETKDRLKTYTAAIITKLADSIKDYRNKLTGNPLQVKLMAEIFTSPIEGEQKDFDTCKEFISKELCSENSNDIQPNMPKRLDLTYLYQKFVDLMLDRNFRKREKGERSNSNDPTVIEERGVCYNMAIGRHKKMALHALFGKDTAENLLPDVEIEPEITTQRSGIITRFDINGRPHFRHQTYAEYFAATAFLDTLKKGKPNDEVKKIFATEILLMREYYTLRAFMNSLVSSEHYNALKDESWKSYLIKSVNKWHENIFHVAVSEGNSHIIKMFFKRNLKALIDEKSCHVVTPVELAVLYGHLDELKLLVDLTNYEINTAIVKDRPLSLLHIAAMASEFNIVRYLLGKGANVNAKVFHSGATALHLVICYTFGIPIMALENAEFSELEDFQMKRFLERFNLLHLLVNQGADVNLQSDYHTPLHEAVAWRRWQKCRYFVDPTANSQHPNRATSVPIHKQKNELDIVKYLCQSGANVHCGTKLGLTPLQVASISGSLDVVKYLVRDKGADANSKDNKGRTSLHFAAREGHLTIVQYLCKQGAKVDCRTDTDGWTPLHSASMGGSLDVVEYLVRDKGADVNSKENIKGATSLHLAALMGHLTIVKYLCKQGANVDCRTDTGGFTPLHFASKRGNLDVVEYLVRDKGADVNSKLNINGATSLHLAAGKGQLTIVEYLCKQGMNVDCGMDTNGWTPLHSASSGGSLDVVEYLVRDKGADVNSKANIDGVTSLHVAVLMGHLIIVEYLCKQGANVDCRTDLHGQTPLHFASMRGSLDVVEYLVRDKGADVNSKDNTGRNSLHLAAQEGQLTIVEYLCKQGANVDCRTDTNGWTPLHFASMRGRLDVVEYLVRDKGADVNSKDNTGRNSLHLAAQEGQLTIVEYLCKQGVNVDCRTDTDGWTPLHLASMGGSLDVVEYLVRDKEADANSKNNEGITLLHVAAEKGQLTIVEYLCKQGANVDCRTDTVGRTPLHSASMGGSLDVVKYLVRDKGADANSKDNTGRTSLHLATREGQLTIVKYLCKQGANVDCRTDTEGWTPLHLASIGGSLKVVEYLVKDKGADVNSKDNINGATSLHLAAEEGQLTIVKYLCKQGANVDCRTDTKGFTPLHSASISGSVDVVEYLVRDKGADVNSKENIQGATSLHLAAFMGDLTIVEYLCEQGANIHSTSKSMETPLYTAYLYGKSDIVKYLHKKGAHPLTKHQLSDIKSRRPFINFYTSLLKK